MIDGLVGGVLYGAAEKRTSKGGKPFTTAKVRVPCGDGEPLYVNVIAFDIGACSALLALKNGDAVSLAGTLTPGAFIDKNGLARPALNVTASQVLTAYHVNHKRKAMAPEPNSPARGGALGAEYDDDI